MPNLDEEYHRHHDVNPLFIGLLGVIAGAIIVATLHFMLLGWCNSEERRQEAQENERPWRNVRIGHNNNSTARERIASSSSMSNSSLQSIPTFKYTKECNEGVCAICLGEFKENEELRVLPECAHHFHVACIDRWLGSHPNCPLCRADIVPSVAEQAAAVSSRGSFDHLDVLFEEHGEAVLSRSEADRVHIIMPSEHALEVSSRDDTNEGNIESSQHVVTISTRSDAGAASSSEISVGAH